MKNIPERVRKAVEIQAKKIYRFSYHRMRGIFEEEDFRQSAYLKLIKDGLLYSDTPIAIISTVARRACADLTRTVHKQRAPNTLRYLPLSDDSVPEPVAKDLWGKTNNNLTFEKLNGLLTERETFVINMYRQGYKLWEIGEMIDRTEAAMSLNKKSAIKKMKKFVTYN